MTRHWNTTSRPYPLVKNWAIKIFWVACCVNIGETYLNRDKDDSALYYFKKSLIAYENTENIPYSLNDIGKTYIKKGNYNLAEQYHKKALSFAKKLALQLDIVQSYLGLGATYYKEELL